MEVPAWATYATKANTRAMKRAEVMVDDTKLEVEVYFVFVCF
jgi:hypothetical protein